jgi:hypothetical protein
MVAYQQADTKEFKGVLNNANVVMNGLTFTGTTNTNRSWNLLGNPFPCALIWTSDAEWNKTNIGGVANIWNSVAKSYTPINAGEIIPNGNGFMVSVNNAAGGSLTIPTAKRTPSAPNWYKSSSYPVIKLFAKNLDNPSYQESQIRFNPESTLEYDNEYDCDFLAGYAPYFYSVMGVDKLMVNSLPEFSEETVIPYNFIKNEGTNFSIEATGIETLEPTAIVFLKDNQLGINHNLSDNPVYVFTSNPEDAPARFELHFSSVGINELQANQAINAWYNNGSLTVKTKEGVTQIGIFNIQGQNLQNHQLYDCGIQSISINLPTGVYLARIIYNDNIQTIKMIVK